MDMFYNKHYIRTNESGMVIKGFSNAFEQPLEADICINEKGGRHFQIGSEINPPLIDDNGCHLYRYDNSAVRKSTDEEIAAELAEIEANTPEPEISDQELSLDLLADHEYRLCLLELDAM